MSWITTTAVDQYLNLAASPAVTIFEGDSTWDVRAGLNAQGVLIRSFSTQSEAQDFVHKLLAEQGLSAL